MKMNENHEINTLHLLFMACHFYTAYSMKITTTQFKLSLKLPVVSTASFIQLRVMLCTYTTPEDL